ncbi:UDP-phosphate alpha N-acetylglucosaminyltransferase [uncultured Roseibium sp.]|uniref:UDP-phosphate alpha N-acetylglucosaminyltransferase n=1 Tax=uncultured Roseibium sp. TaxID=1936171 RepID=UPI002604501D|nr:UDP-phosphate alpha N-acetylglucosaminyltransferase [uncultured Roseibium sp.]
MLYSQLSDRPAFAGTLQDIEERRYRLWLNAVSAVVIAALTFNFLLAVFNTNLFGISESHVILTELALIGCALLLAVSRNPALYVILALYLSYMAFILALRPELDLKAIRDFLIPIIFYFIGRKFQRIEDADRLIWTCTLIVLAIGFLEFLFLDLYTQIVDIFGYYVARGTLEIDDNFIEGSNLFVSSTRVGGRNFFDFLGQIRASSVFLEPVTMGNFGAFLCLWALFRKGMKHRLLLLVLAFVVIVLADARFGMFVCFFLFVAAGAAYLVPRFLWWCLPPLIVFALAVFGGLFPDLPWADNFIGRLIHASHLQQLITLDALFGLRPDVPFLADNGFAYSIVKCGIIGLLALWTLFVYAPSNAPQALHFKALAVVYISLLMTVSNSFYSIKLAALFWVAAGAADIMKSSAGSAQQQSVSAKPPPPHRANRSFWSTRDQNRQSLRARV